MSTPWLDIQRAIYSALTGDGTLTGKVSTRIYDFVPDNIVYPYIFIGDAEYTDQSSHTSDGFEGTFTIHSWARPATRGRAAVLDIMSDVYRLLHEASLSITGFDIVSLRYDFSTVLVEDDRVTYHGVTRFKILIGGNYSW